MDRRQVLAASMALSIAAFAASRAHGQPRPFAVTSHVEILGAAAATQAPVPVPGVDTERPCSRASRWSGNTGEAAPDPRQRR